MAFAVYWQQMLAAITGQEVGQDELLTLIADVLGLTATAQAAADAANAAAATANAAATASADATALQGSYVTGITITATDAGADATINISAHTRHYPQADGTTTDVAVDAGSVTGLAYSTGYWIYYDDAARTGGAVTYAATTVEGTAAQVGDRHSVGAVTTPAAAAPDETGQFVKWPGYVAP